MGGKIHVVRYEMLNPYVVVDGNMALLTYNLVNYISDGRGGEAVGTRWNSTTVYHRCGDAWKTIHSHWSFTSHPAFQAMTAEATEGLAWVVVNNRFGYIDSSGRVAIRASFDEAANFSDGLAPVKVEEHWGYIDKTGKDGHSRTIRERLSVLRGPRASFHWRQVRLHR